MLIYRSQFLCYKCYDSLLCFVPFLFFFLNTLRDMSCFAIFLMKTLLTLKYPVFIIVTNSNSKVHPFTERTDGKPLVQESCGKCNTWNHGKTCMPQFQATFSFVVVLKA